MLYHQWLNSMSNPQPSAGTLNGRDMQMADTLPPPAEHQRPGVYEKIMLPYGCVSSLSGYCDHQAAYGMTEASSDQAKHENATRASTTANENSYHHHLPMRLSHIERSVQLDTQMALYRQSDQARNKYHEAMQRVTEIQWSQQLSKAFAHPDLASRDSRDSEACEGRPPRRSGLAATHPANYNLPQESQNMLPSALPPLPPFDEIMDGLRTTPLLWETLLFDTASSMSSSSEASCYSDPMWQSSVDPHFWGVNGTILRSDRHLEPANVISPTWMIGLPCGSMIEMAHHYPSKEALEETLKDSA